MPYRGKPFRFRGKPFRFRGDVSAARGALTRLLRVAGYRWKPSRFSGAVSVSPGVVETAFESCRLPRKPLSLLWSSFGGSGGALRRLLRRAGNCGNPSRFSGAIFGGSGGRRGGYLEVSAPSENFLASPEPFRRLRGALRRVEAAFETCQLPFKAFSLLRSRFRRLRGGF